MGHRRRPFRTAPPPLPVFVEQRRVAQPQSPQQIRVISPTGVITRQFFKRPLGVNPGDKAPPPRPLEIRLAVGIESSLGGRLGRAVKGHSREARQPSESLAEIAALNDAHEIENIAALAANEIEPET